MAEVTPHEARRIPAPRMLPGVLIGLLVLAFGQRSVQQGQLHELRERQAEDTQD